MNETIHTLIPLLALIFVILSFAQHLVMIRFFLMYLQQSSYRNQRFWNRLKEKGKDLFMDKIGVPYALLSLVLLIVGICYSLAVPSDSSWISSLLGLSIVGVLIAFIVNISIFLYHQIPSFERERIPLVRTHRVNRLIGSSLTLLLAIYGGLIYWGYYHPTTILIGIIPFFIGAAPALLMMVNWGINPIEKAIQQRFIRDAKRIRSSMPGLITIGITGSYGKTSTKNIIHSILAQHQNTLMTPANYNTDLGITRTIREQLKHFHQSFVVEMGAKEVGDILACCEITKPNIGVLTVIGTAHLESFKHINNIVNTKAELVRYLDEDGVAIFNADDPYTFEIIKDIRAKRRWMFGIESDNATIRARHVEVQSSGCRFEVHIQSDPPYGGSYDITTKLLGKHSIYNILAGIAVGIELRIPIAAIQYAVETLVPVPHRLELKKESKNRLIIDDAYNSNPSGFEDALQVLDSFDKSYRKIIITPGLVELGAKEAEWNYRMGATMGTLCDDIILVGKKRAEPILKGIRTTSFDLNHLHIATDFFHARTFLNSSAKEVVLYENDLPDIYSR